MRDQRIVILGGRSGTSLVQQCLISTNKYNNWGGLGETPIRHVVFKYYPNIPEEYFPNDFDLAKSPQFDIILDKIIEKYSPKFIVLERDIIQRLNSHVKMKWHKKHQDYIKNRYKNSYLVNSIGNINNPVLFDYNYWKFYDNKREHFLKNYDQKKILRIKYEDIMNKFEEAMKNVAKFCNIEPELDTWNKLRRRKVVQTKTNVSLINNSNTGILGRLQVFIRHFFPKFLYIQILSILDGVGIIEFIYHKFFFAFKLFFEIFKY